MAVRLLFPTPIFHRNFTQENLSDDRGFDKDYCLMLRDEMDAMRRRDPVGRQLSNQYTGWQSNDGCESNPTFQKCMNRIITFFNDETLPYHGLDPSVCRMEITNSWANINDNGAWNAPHLHNGCWYSGVFYIHAEGDEGRISFLDTHQKVAADFPNSPRTPTSYPFTPLTGECILFPSGLMHMVEPNPTNKERYSISFNTIIDYQGLMESRNGQVEDYNENEFLFDLDIKGNPIR